MRWAMMMAMVLLLSCCTRQVYVPVETVRTEVSVTEKIRVDTFDRYRDRVVYQRGDTIFDVMVEYVYRTKEVHDSAYVHLTDSIEVPVEVKVPVEVERRMTLWERIKNDTYGYLAAISLGCLCWIFRKKLLRLVYLFVNRD